MAKKKKMVKGVEKDDKATEVGTEPDEFEVLDMEPVEEEQRPAPGPIPPPTPPTPPSAVVEMEDIEEPAKPQPPVIKEPPNVNVRDVSEEGVGAKDLEILGAGEGPEEGTPKIWSPGQSQNDVGPGVVTADADPKEPEAHASEKSPPAEEQGDQGSDKDIPEKALEPLSEEEIPELLDLQKREKRVTMREEEVRMKEENLARKLDEITMKIKELDNEVKEKIRLEYRIKRRDDELQNKMERLNSWEQDLRDRLRRFSEYEKHLKAQAEELIKRTQEIKTNEERHHKELMQFEKQRDEFENWRRDQVGIEHRLKLMEQDLENDRAAIQAKEEEVQRSIDDIKRQELEIQSKGGDLSLKSEKLDQLKKQEQELQAKAGQLRAQEEGLKVDRQRLAKEDEELNERREELSRIAEALKKKEDSLREMEEKLKEQPPEPVEPSGPVEVPQTGPKGDISIGGPAWAQAPGTTPEQPAWNAGTEHGADEVLQVDEEPPATVTPPKPQPARPPEFIITEVAPPPKPIIAPPKPDGKPLKKIRCTSCKAIIPIYTEVRPLDIQCPSCGKKGRLLK